MNDLLREPEKMGVKLSSTLITPNTHLLKDDGVLFDHPEIYKSLWGN